VLFSIFYLFWVILLRSSMLVAWPQKWLANQGFAARRSGDTGRVTGMNSLHPSRYLNINYLRVGLCALLPSMLLVFL
jgi:hypothetical protein